MPQENSQPAKRRFTNWVLGGLAVALLIGTAWTGWRVWSIQGGRSALEARIAELKERGAPIDADGVKRLHESNTKGELTPRWTELLDKFSSMEYITASESFPIVGIGPAEQDLVPLMGEEWNKEAAAKRFMVDWKRERETLRSLSTTANCVFFPMRYDGEEHGSKPLDAPYSQALKLLALEAQMALRMDGTAVAIHDVHALYGMSDLLKGEPSGLSMAYGLQAEQMARDVIQRCVEQGRLKEPQLRELMGILELRKLDRDRYQIAIQGERGMLLPIYDSLSKKQGWSRYVQGDPQSRLMAIEMFSKLEAMSFDDLSASKAALDAMVDEIGLASLGRPHGPDAMAPSSLLPLISIGARLCQHELQTRLAMVAIGIQIYRSKQGRLPATLEQLSEVGIEPSKIMPQGLKPFGYRLNDDGKSARLWTFPLGTHREKNDDLSSLEDKPEYRSWIWKLK